MKQLTATVVVITADRPAEVHRCLDSFYGELPPKCDVIVVDASRDGQTEKLVTEFGGVHYLRSPVRNLGAQRNLGVRASTKDVVAFLDDDAVAHRGWLQALLAPYEDLNVASVVGAIRQDDLPIQPADAGPVRTPRGLRQPIINWQQTSKIDVLNGQGGNMSFRKATLEQVGLWDEMIHGGCGSGEDLDVFIRLRRRGGRIRYNPEAVVTHRPGPTEGYTRSQYNRHYMFWTGYNMAYGNAKHFLGRKEFFWYWLVDPWRFLFVQGGRLVRAVANNCSVTVYHLAGRVYGFGNGIRARFKG